MASESHAKEIASLRFRLAAVLALRECLRLLFVWIMIWAAAVVGLRALFRVDQLVLLWGLVGLGAAAAVGALRAMRRVPSSAAVRAVLDRHGCLGGLLMAAGDTDIGQWGERIAGVPAPALRWRSRRQWTPLAASVGFLIAAFLAPERCLPSVGDPSLQIGGEAQKLAAKIEVLKRERVLPPEKAQALEKDLERLREEALGTDPAKTMESIDHLEQSLKKAAAEAAQSAVKQTETAKQAQELAAALQEARGKMDPKLLGEAMKELAKLADQAAAENKELDESLSEELQEALDQGDLSDKQLEELREALKDFEADEKEMLERLVDAELIDASELELVEGELSEDGEEALLAILCRCKNGGDLAAALAGKGGRGGGGPPAALTWQKELERGDAAFKEKVLPSARAASLKKSRLAGISAADPKSARAGGGSVGGALSSAQAGGGEARTQTILPEHEKTVQRYFNRGKK
jgi:hypothetical protein